MKKNVKERIKQFIADYCIDPLAEMIKKSEQSKASASSKVGTTNFAERCEPWSDNCQVGDFVYPSGLVTDMVQEAIQAIGVVGWRNPDPNATVGQRGMIICLNEARRAWSNNELTGVTNFANGWDNTQALLRLVKEKGWSFPAAEWCANYSEDGIKAGEGFLAAREQLEKIFANKTAINASLAKIGATELSGWYWSSSECNYYGGWLVNATSGNVDWYYKHYNYGYVRCVVAF